MSADRLPTENLDAYMTLLDIADGLEGISYRQLQRWAEPGRKTNGFPKPIHVGRFVLYEKEQVEIWVTLWKRATKNFDGTRIRNAERGRTV